MTSNLAIAPSLTSEQTPSLASVLTNPNHRRSARRPSPEGYVGCTARRSPRRSCGAPSRARSADPRQQSGTRPIHPVERVGNRDQPGADPCRHSPAGPAGAVPRTDVIPDPQSKHCGSPIPNHNICYSPASPNAIPLASRYQLRWVLLIRSKSRRSLDQEPRRLPSECCY